MQRAFPFVFLILLLSCIPAFSQGTIVHVDSENVPLFSSGGDSFEHSIDIDSNGTKDFVFQAFDLFQIYSTTGGRSVAIPSGGTDVGSKSVPVLQGFQIDSNLPQPMIWANSFQPIFPPDAWIGASLHSRSFSGSSGLWNPPDQEYLTAFVGVEFNIDEGVHYGWIRVEVFGGGGNGGTIMDWAYNSMPGESILAGQVPEPSTWVLLAGGLVVLGMRRVRRTRRK